MDTRNIITRVDLGNIHFQKRLSRLPPNIQKEARKAVGELLLYDVSNAPAKLHFHPLGSANVTSAIDPNKKVKAYTIHISSDDTYKASFTLEDSTAYMRTCGRHDWVDENP